MLQGKFVVSLDFEMMWGVRDKRTIASYGNNIEAVRTIIPRLVEMAEEAGVHLTFGVVGMLMLKDKKELLAHIPKTIPSYNDAIRSPYGSYIENMSPDDESYHFASDMVEYIKNHPQHEIGSHTYCHYYCLEEGQTIDQFETDLAMAQTIADGNLKSIIFPRNQTNQSYLEICKKYGIKAYRGNEDNKLNTPSAHEGKLKRLLRLLDNYFNLTGYNTYTNEQLLASGEPMNIPASRFLRPFSRKLSFLDGLRLRRIKNAMTHAAKKGETFHVWWHPHNFGDYTEENFTFLKKIFSHYKYLNDKYNFTSMTMSEVYDSLK